MQTLSFSFANQELSTVPGIFDFKSVNLILNLIFINPLSFELVNIKISNLYAIPDTQG